MPKLPQDAPLLLRAQLATGFSQEKFGAILGVSRKTVSRWRGQVTLQHSQAVDLTRAVYPHDAEIAAEVAATAGETLESLGLVVPAPPPPPPPAPSLAHLVDAVVLAAAESAGELSPKLRPLLLAAFDRAAAMGLSVEEVAKGLRGDAPRAPGTS